MTLWYAARAAGMVALIAFTMATTLGALSSRHSRAAQTATLDRRFLVQMAHRSAAITGLLALAAHVVLMVMDRFVDVSIGGALVPFSAGYEPFALALGTFSVYVFILVALSGAARGRLAASARGARAWRSVHLLAYVGWAMSMTHGILAGTDTGTIWSTAIYVACGLAVTIAVALRLVSRTSSQPTATARTLERSRS